MKNEEHLDQIELDEEGEKNIFLLGLFVLFAWMVVIILCASPQLFRNFIQRHFCCCLLDNKQKHNKIREAREGMLMANQSFLRSTIAENPSKILVTQVMRSRKPRQSHIEIPEPIPEESRGSSTQPTNRSVSISTPENSNYNDIDCLTNKPRTHSVSFAISDFSNITNPERIKIDS